MVSAGVMSSEHIEIALLQSQPTAGMNKNGRVELLVVALYTVEGFNTANYGRSSRVCIMTNLLSV